VEVVAEAEDPGARAALPRIADARLAAGRRTGLADSPHTEIPREGLRCERALTAATAGAAAPAALQQPDAMHVAGGRGLRRRRLPAGPRLRLRRRGIPPGLRLPRGTGAFLTSRLRNGLSFPVLFGQFRTMGTLGLRWRNIAAALWAHPVEHFFHSIRIGMGRRFRASAGTPPLMRKVS